MAMARTYARDANGRFAGGGGGKPRATGGTLAVTFLGVVFGSPLVGWISNATGTYRSGFIALSLLAFTCFSLLTWLSQGKKPSLALKATP